MVRGKLLNTTVVKRFYRKPIKIMRRLNRYAIRRVYAQIGSKKTACNRATKTLPKKIKRAGANGTMYKELCRTGKVVRNTYVVVGGCAGKGEAHCPPHLEL